MASYHLLNLSIPGSSDPYVVVDLEGKQQKTETINNNLNPKWSNGKFSLYVSRYHFCSFISSPPLVDKLLILPTVN